MLASYLSVPVEFLEHIRTRREALVLTNVGTCAHRFDGLLATITDLTAANRSFTDLAGVAMQGEGGGVTALIPLLHQAMEPTCDAGVRERADDCRTELRGLAGELEYFVEMNDSSAKEFDEAGCSDRANAKRIVASVERILAQRIMCIIGTEGLDGSVWACTAADLCAAN